MRFLLLPAMLFTVLCSPHELSAQVPNGSFEAWFDVPSSPLVFPEFWSFNGSPTGQHLTQTTTARTGQFAVRGEVQSTGQPAPFDVVLPIASSVALFGPGSTTPPEPGFPHTVRETEVSGYYMLGPVGDDELLVTVSMVRWTGTDTTAVGFGALTRSGAQSTFTRFTVPINYSSGDSPTHCWIKITFGGLTPSEPGSWYIVDDVSFSTGTAVQPDEQPDHLAVFQNYPNPFDTTTEIEFVVPRPAFVRVAVLDLLARRVQEFVPGNLPPGRHSVTWDASAMPAGIYVYRVEVDDAIVTRTMAVVK